MCYAIVDTGGKLWFLPRPKGVPKNRGGHGMPLRLLIDELTHAGFVLVSSEEKFSRRLPGCLQEAELA